MNTNWNAYRIFFYVASCGTTSAAANELHIAQPAVSHGIKQLEESLGCKLFHRSSHGMELTSMGTMLYEHIAGAVTEIENAEKLLEAEVRAAHTVIRVGVSDITLQHFLIPYLEAFEKQKPDIEVTIHHGQNVEAIMKLFAEEKIDFAILHDASENEEDFESIPVKEIQDILFYSAKFADRVHDTQLTPEDLPRYPLVMHEEGCVMRKNEEAYFAENGVSVKPVYEYALNQSVVNQVKRKFALGIVYHEVITDDLERGSLIEMPLNPPLPTRYFYLIRPKKIRRKAARIFVYYILSSKATS